MYHLSENWKLYIFTLLFVIGSAIYMVDQPEHVEFVNATISTAIAAGPTQQRAVIAELNNGVQIIINNYPIHELVLGAKIKLDRRASPLLGRSNYYFVEYID